jgi:hypothetical protein
MAGAGRNMWVGLNDTINNLKCISLDFCLFNCGTSKSYMHFNLFLIISNSATLLHRHLFIRRRYAHSGNLFSSRRFGSFCFNGAKNIL